MHEIDPDMGDEAHQAKLNNIHSKPSRPNKLKLDNSPPDYDGPGPMIRC